MPCLPSEDPGTRFMPLSAGQKQHITEVIGDVESRHPLQLVASVAEKSDVYPELPWRAFAVGVSLSTPLIFVFLRQSGATNALITLTPLVFGLALMALTVLVPPIARLFLIRH